MSTTTVQQAVIKIKQAANQVMTALTSTFKRLAAHIAQTWPGIVLALKGHTRIEVMRNVCKRKGIPMSRLRRMTYRRLKKQFFAVFN